MAIPALPFCRAKLTASWRTGEYPKEFRHLGDYIRAKRLDLGLQVKQLAKLLKADEGSVASWEGGGRRPSLYKLPRIFEFIGGDPRPDPGSLGGGASDSGVNGTDYRSRNVRGYFGSILAPLRDGRMAGDTRSDVFDRRC